MKRKLGTFVLFALLILTVVALTSLDTPPAPRSVGTTNSNHATN